MPIANASMESKAHASQRLELVEEGRHAIEEFAYRFNANASTVIDESGDYDNLPFEALEERMEEQGASSRR